MDTLLVAPDPGALHGGKHRTVASCCAVLSAVPHEISSSPHSVPPCYPFQKIFTAGDDRVYQYAFLLWPVNFRAGYCTMAVPTAVIHHLNYCTTMSHTPGMDMAWTPCCCCVPGAHYPRWLQPINNHMANTHLNTTWVSSSCALESRCADCASGLMLVPL